MASRKPQQPANKSRAITDAVNRLKSGSAASAKHQLKKAEERRKRLGRAFTRPKKEQELRAQAAGESKLGRATRGRR